MIRFLIHFGLIWAALTVSVVAAAAADGEHEAAAPSDKSDFYAFEARRLDGPTESLDAYRGQVILVVNTASRCGNTPQYEALQALYQEHRDQGFTVLGFPSNDFGNQEPGSDREIGEFCKLNYGVSFPMFSKVHVTGGKAIPLYVWLTSQPEPVGGPVLWNFQKYLVDRSGHVVKRFDSKVTPDDPRVTEAVEQLLQTTNPG